MVAPNSGFAQAAVDAVSRWKFKPALRNGVVVATLLNVPLAFALKPGSPSASPPTLTEISALYLAMLKDWKVAIGEIVGPNPQPVAGAPPPLVSAAIVLNAKGILSVAKVEGEPDSTVEAELRKSMTRTLSHRNPSAALMAYMAEVHGFKVSLPGIAGPVASTAGAASP